MFVRALLYVLILTVLGFVALYPKPAQYSPLKWSKFHNSIFVALSRPAFILSLMLLILLL
jgi:hypothetical protein